MPAGVPVAGSPLQPVSESVSSAANVHASFLAVPIRRTIQTTDARLSAIRASIPVQTPGVLRDPLEWMRNAIAGEVRAVVTMDAVDVTPVEVGVTELGFSEHDDPDGAPVHVRATAVVNPFKPVTVTVEDPVAPAAMLTDAGVAVILKSGLVVPPMPVSVAVCGLLASLSETLRVAVTAPVMVGVNVTLIVQLAPAARDDVQRLFCAKEDAFAPVMLTAMPVIRTALLFFSVTVFAELVVLTPWFPKATVAGERKTGAGARPVPVSSTVCGLEGSLSATISVAVSAATNDGVNVMGIAHVAPAAILPVQFVLPIVKSAASAPPIETFEIVRLLPVRLARVTISGWLPTPTSCWPKFSVDGLRITPVAAAGESFATNAAPVLNVVWNAPAVTGKSEDAVAPPI